MLGSKGQPHKWQWHWQGPKWHSGLSSGWTLTGLTEGLLTEKQTDRQTDGGNLQSAFLRNLRNEFLSAWKSQQSPLSPCFSSKWGIYFPISTHLWYESPHTGLSALLAPPLPNAALNFQAFPVCIPPSQQLSSLSVKSVRISPPFCYSLSTLRTATWQFHIRNPPEWHASSKSTLSNPS